jgi:hypothetical protein
MMDKGSARCKFVEERLKKCLSVLEPYLPFLNAYSTDFITHNYWEKFIDKSIADKVLKLSDDELARLPGGLLFQRQNKNSSLDSDLNSAPNSECSPTLSDISERRPRWPHKNLEDFLTSIMSCTLPNLGVDTSLQTLKQRCFTSSKYDALSIHHYMSEKKCHEVEIMGEVCARLADSMETKRVRCKRFSRKLYIPFKNNCSSQHGMAMVCPSDCC